ncbi:hypothetical protein [Sphingobium yanoikuyae]|uniref:Uncharacterized protein n=1 Tax=Sphingobium yanoikuyae TaxID=13690 RepID=A0A3G2UVH8_SPHYA|nr:hypothetical protein [Sphingobium yanoikuyae]AYO78218.1 hypothetical protein EBF16_15790 [Sphingobium yanoikuyae]
MQTVCLEYGDGCWFVAKPKAVPDGQFTHERAEPGYANHIEAADAAIAFAIVNELPVEDRNTMIEAAHETMEFLAADRMSDERIN